MHPPDTVMSRMYNQTGNLYSSAWDCLKSTVKVEGPLAVYKGFFAHLARILPHTVSLCLDYPVGGPERVLISVPDLDAVVGGADEQGDAEARGENTKRSCRGEDTIDGREKV
jgi:hypothetical protein